jgi:PAS domain S-box-containing protein
MKKTGVGIQLPGYLQKSEKYAAFICGPNKKLLSCNSFFKKIFSLADSKADCHLKDIFPGTDLHLFSESSLMLSSKPAVCFATTVNKCHINWELVFLEDGQPEFLCTGYILYAEGAGKINLDETHFSAFMNNSPALMWATSTDGRVVIMNKKYKDETGLNDYDNGKLLWELFPKVMADKFKENDEKVLAHNQLLEMEETSVDRFGRKREYLVYKFPLQTADYGMVVAGWSVDITEHKNANRQLLHQNNRFRQIARLQSHAVRRPLANILGLIDLIQHYSAKSDFTEVAAMVNLLKQSSTDLDAIIKKIVNKTGAFQPSIHKTP